MGRRTLVWVLVAVAAAGCSDANLSEPEGLGLDAAAYLELALNIMELNSLHRYEIDWVQFRQTAIAEAGNARTPAETYDVIENALERIGDNHSFFQRPGAAPGAAALSRAAPTLADPMTELIEPEIGYVDVPAFSGGGPAGDSLAVVYHALIEQVDTTGVCGWVVDVRGNTGGNMWPMLAGVGPILGEGNMGFFVNADSVFSEWVYSGGRARIETTVIAEADPFYQPLDSLPPVALLTDGQTASSGEAVVVAFRAREDARSFGSSTFGVSTANAGFGLTDGAVIFLTVARMADRTGQVYGMALDPDLVVDGDKTGDRATDAALEAALDWLEASHCS